MIDKTDFVKKQMVFYFPSEGDKLSFKNDNLIITDKEGKIKWQVTCYRLFLVFIVGDTSITTGLLSRAKKFGFSLCLMNRNMKVYQFISARMEGNTQLRKIQYDYTGTEIGQHIILNKVQNQRNALMNLRHKDDLMKETIKKLDMQIQTLQGETLDLNVIMGIEGISARLYFAQMFNNIDWKGRKPRIKHDFVNASLDIGYTILFNIIDALVNVFGFDEYYGVLHRNFYMRKSLVCDLMEPMRPIIDYSIRKAINLKQFSKDDFNVIDQKYRLNWNKSLIYTKVLLNALLEYKEELFLYIQSYYRATMKRKNTDEFPIFKI